MSGQMFIEHFECFVKTRLIVTGDGDDMIAVDDLWSVYDDWASSSAELRLSKVTFFRKFPAFASAFSNAEGRVFWKAKVSITVYRGLKLIEGKQES